MAGVECLCRIKGFVSEWITPVRRTPDDCPEFTCQKLKVKLSSPGRRHLKKLRSSMTRERKLIAVFIIGYISTALVCISLLEKKNICPDKKREIEFHRSRTDLLFYQKGDTNWNRHMKQVLKNTHDLTSGHDFVATVASQHIQKCAENSTRANKSGFEPVFKKVTLGVFLYSAFYDLREDDHIIRIIAAVNRKQINRTKLYCHFVLPDNLNMSSNKHDGSVTTVSNYQMCEHHNRQYGGWIVSCGLPKTYVTQGIKPCSVSISPSPHDRFTNSVEMSILTTVKSPEVAQLDFIVCVPPLFGNLRTEVLVQFVELNMILGIKHFVFYFYEGNPRLKQVLEYYKSIGIATVMAWSLPFASRDIWYYGQLVSINDCLYRHMATVKHLMFMDVDEFLIPHAPKMTTWREIVARTGNSNTSCGLTFQSAFFDIALRANGNYSINNLTVLDITSRTKYFCSTRNKVLVEPYKIFEMGIHHVSRPWPDGANYSVTEISSDIAFIHHYRQCPNALNIDCFNGVDDVTVVQNYGGDLYKRFLRTLDMV